MILKNFYINLNIELRDEKAIDYRYTFNTKTRHICNYIERNCLKKLKFETDFFQSIVIELRYGFDEKFMKVPPFISSNKSLAIIDTFDKTHYDRITTDKDFRFFIEKVIEKNLKNVREFDLPTQEILNSYKDLSKNNFINKWIIKRKIDKTRNLLVELYGEMKIDKFSLTLKVLKDNTEIYNKEIMETDADENAYLSKVKKLVIEDNKIKVLGVRDAITYLVPL